MNEPTEIKYPLDSGGEPYYAATHVQAIQGLEEPDLNDTLKSMSEAIASQQEIIDSLNKRIEKLEEKE
ncbi:MAG: hypothetical protein L0J91_06415 [Lactococcus lactis]|nr:hypothetical protein [Staphylococcus equorum]MDN6391554.1 hypothetical protein [Lactococcus lactis]MDN6423308.1 hypothetical protein [Tetragenococcus koreensis]MDN6640655.1 hypothetical protein [Tetragenococcus sp.]